MNFLTYQIASRIFDERIFFDGEFAINLFEHWLTKPKD